MKPSRRWLQYSLRSFLVALTALAIWLGVVVNRAREQREAVKAIEALGGHVWYDWELNKLSSGIWDFHEGEPGAPGWLRHIIGDDYFQHVRGVRFHKVSTETEANILESIPHLRQLDSLGVVFLPVIVSNASNELTDWNNNATSEVAVSEGTIDKLETIFPNCEALGFAPTPMGD